DGLKQLGRNLVGKDDMRTTEHAARGNTAEGAGELDRRRGNSALADADRDGLAGEPLFMLSLQLPNRGGHDPGDLVGQIDASLLREAEGVSIFCDGVDAKTVCQRVVKRVARIRNGVVNVDHAVVLVAGIEVAVEGGAAVALDVHGLGDVLL